MDDGLIRSSEGSSDGIVLRITESRLSRLSLLVLSQDLRLRYTCFRLDSNLLYHLNL